MKETLKGLLIEFHENGLPSDLIRRDIDLTAYIPMKVAKVIVGPRRAGKTYLLYQIMKDLGRDITDYVYLNFEDNRLIGFTYNNFEDILEAYGELYPNKKPILFLDEIHNIEKWELFVRRLVDNGYEVYLTGSNAHLLSREYATKLGGRYIEITLLPLSFREFLTFKGYRVKKHVQYSKERFTLLKYFEEYLNYGGFPAIALLNEKRDELLRQYLDSIIYRDVISRFNVEDERVLDLFLKKLSENVTNPYSFNSIVRKLKVLGIKTNVKTLSNYYEHLKEVFLILHSSLDRESILKKEMERKSYFVDNGLLKLFYIGENREKLLENVVAIELFRKKGKLKYYRNGYEIDFVEPVIQVSWELNENNRDREINALLKYMKMKNLKEGYILTYNQREEIKVDDFTIKVLPVWQWMLK